MKHSDSRHTGLLFALDARSEPGLERSLCTRSAAPLSYDLDVPEVKGKRVQLFIRKFPASSHAKGSVWLIAGGPSESGALFYPLIDTLRLSFPELDLMILDHRGTGYSTRLYPREESRAEGAAISPPNP